MVVKLTAVTIQAILRFSSTAPGVGLKNVNAIKSNRSGKRKISLI